MKYAYLRRYDCNIHVLQINPSHDRVELKEVSGVKKTTDIAASNYASAATNGGFFWQGKSIGNLVVNGQVVNRYIPAQKEYFSAVGIKNGKLHIDVYPNNLSVIDSLGAEGYDWLLMGNPMITKDGALFNNSVQENTADDIRTRTTSRTAIGYSADGDIYLVVVQGGLTNSKGLHLNTLGQFMADIGCDRAVNLDGGGSSTFYHYEELKNKPSTDILHTERSVTNAICVFEQVTNMQQINLRADAHPQASAIRWSGPDQNLTVLGQKLDPNQEPWLKVKLGSDIGYVPNWYFKRGL